MTGCSSIPQAVTAPIVVPSGTEDAPPVPQPPQRSSRRWNLHETESRVGIESGELMASFHSTVPRFRGFITSNLDRAVIDFDLRSLHNESRVVAAIIQEQYLEVDRYPFAHVDVFIGDGKARGVLELHGVRRKIEFPVTVEKSPGKVRVRTAFKIARHDFDIVRIGGWDWIAHENVAIDFDLVAAPERVTAEEL